VALNISPGIVITNYKVYVLVYPPLFAKTMNVHGENVRVRVRVQAFISTYKFYIITFVVNKRDWTNDWTGGLGFRRENQRRV
jgi:hypothetical protein